MNILVYTRIENNTGGDETLLSLLIPSLIKNLSEGANVSLALSHDDASEARALNIKAKWEKLMQDKGFKQNVWLFEGNSGSSALTSCLCVTHKLMGKQWKNFQLFTKEADYFVIAGWSHQLTSKSAKYLKEQLKLQTNCKILLCAVPGMSINAKGFQDSLHQLDYKVYSFQLGIGAACGIPMINTLTQSLIETDNIRMDWLKHIGEEFTEYTSFEAEKRLDKLIVIYCSKDNPGLSGITFLENISKEIIPDEYPVLLIGSTEINFKLWNELCLSYGFRSCTPINRTAHSGVLMRGLRDAKYSMATGAYSILEARYLEIDHCEYLCPPHMKQLGDMLSNSSNKDFKAAFLLGEEALEELGELPLADFQPKKTQAENSWRHSEKDGWRNYLSNSLSYIANEELLDDEVQDEKSIRYT